MQLQNGAPPGLSDSPPLSTPHPPSISPSRKKEPLFAASQPASQPLGQKDAQTGPFFIILSHPSPLSQHWLSARLRTFPVPAVVFAGLHPLLALCYALRLTRCGCAGLRGQGSPWLPRALWGRRRRTQLVYVHQTAVLLLLLLLPGMSAAELNCVIYMSPAKCTSARSLVHIPMHYTLYIHIYKTAWTKRSSLTNMKLRTEDKYEG